MPARRPSAQYQVRSSLQPLDDIQFVECLLVTVGQSPAIRTRGHQLNLRYPGSISGYQFFQEALFSTESVNSVNPARQFAATIRQEGSIVSPTYRRHATGAWNRMLFAVMQ